MQSVMYIMFNLCDVRLLESKVTFMSFDKVAISDDVKPLSESYKIIRCSASSFSFFNHNHPVRND